MVYCFAASDGAAADGAASDGAAADGAAADGAADSGAADDPELEQAETTIAIAARPTSRGRADSLSIQSPPRARRADLVTSNDGRASVRDRSKPLTSAPPPVVTASIASFDGFRYGRSGVPRASLTPRTVEGPPWR